MVKQKIFKRIRGLYVPRYWTILYNNIFDIDEVVFSKLSETEQEKFLGKKQFLGKSEYCPNQCLVGIVQVDIFKNSNKLEYNVIIKIYRYKKMLKTYEEETSLYVDMTNTNSPKKALLMASNKMKAFFHHEYKVMNSQEILNEFPPIYELDVPSLWSINRNLMFDILDAYTEMSTNERKDMEFNKGYINEEVFSATSLPSLEYKNIFAFVDIDCKEKNSNLKYWVTFSAWHKVVSN